MMNFPNDLTKFRLDCGQIISGSREDQLIPFAGGSTAQKSNNYKSEEEDAKILELELLLDEQNSVEAQKF